MNPWICHITHPTAWQTAQQQGVYTHPSLTTEGFIHCSDPGQVVATAERFFTGQTGLVLLWIRGDRLTAPLKFESVPGHGTFPHLYGPLNLDAVDQVSPLVADGQGRFTLPPAPEVSNKEIT
ncbi:MAG: DUF952 domain-containing protein [Cyanobacteria bacterium P01_G01_bin.54]